MGRSLGGWGWGPDRVAMSPLGRRAGQQEWSRGSRGHVSFGAIEILVLCTANQCRSPMVEGMLRARIVERGIADAMVTSAGFLSEGRPATDEAVEVMAMRGIDIGEHRSRVVSAEYLEDADLVLAMARRHVREAAVLTPECFPRTFTLKELLRRADQVGARQAGEPPGDWLARLHVGRSPTQHLGDSPDDDIADPVGSPLRVYKRTARDLDALVEAFVERTFP